LKLIINGTRVEEVFASIGVQTKPDEHRFGERVDLSHERNLNVLFRNATLVDAESIDPENETRIRLTEMSQKLEEVFSNRNRNSVNLYLSS
jgi:hypothetical protein